MIIGVGTDIVKIERVRLAVEDSGERFLRKVFTDAETAHCVSHKDPHPCLSARFAAKEALVKALGGKHGLSLTDIEVLNSPEGAPAFNITGKLAEVMSEMLLDTVHLSMSHEREYAVAFVVIERSVR